jgi:hypothetical protein
MLSSPAKAGDPVTPALARGNARRFPIVNTGCPAFAGHDSLNMRGKDKRAYAIAFFKFSSTLSRKPVVESHF